MRSLKAAELAGLIPLSIPYLLGVYRSCNLSLPAPIPSLNDWGKLDYAAVVLALVGEGELSLPNSYC